MVYYKDTDFQIISVEFGVVEFGLKNATLETETSKCSILADYINVPCNIICNDKQNITIEISKEYFMSTFDEDWIDMYAEFFSNLKNNSLNFSIEM